MIPIVGSPYRKENILLVFLFFLNVSLVSCTKGRIAVSSSSFSFNVGFVCHNNWKCMLFILYDL